MRHVLTCLTFCMALCGASVTYGATIGGGGLSGGFNSGPIDLGNVIAPDLFTQQNVDQIRLCGAPGHEAVSQGLLETTRSWRYAFSAWVALGDTCTNFVRADITLRNLQAGLTQLLDEQVCQDAQWCFASFEQSTDIGTACYEVVAQYQGRTLTQARCGIPGFVVTEPPTLEGTTGRFRDEFEEETAPLSGQ